MLFDKIKKIFAILMLLTFAVSVFAAPSDDLKNRYLDRAEKAFEDGNIEDAYKNVNLALKIQQSDGDVLYYSRLVYRQKLQAILDNYNELELIDVQTNLEKYPEVANDSNIKKILRQIESYQTEQKEAARKAELEAQNKLEEERFKRQQDSLKAQSDAMQESMAAQSDAMKAQTDALKETMQSQSDAMQKSISAQSEAMKAQTEVLKQQSDAFNQNAKETKRSTMVIAFAVIGIAVLIIIIIIVVIALVNRGMKASQQRTEQYMQAFQAIAANQNQTNRLMLGGVTDLYNAQNQMRIAGASTWTPTLSLPDVEFSEDDEAVLKELAIKCEDIGQAIDVASNRKNNSKNVSELVYKLSMHLGVPQGMAMLNFCAAMVYDAGFLGLDSELLTSTSLTDEQKAAMKEHVKLAEKHLDFVPKKYWSVFEDAALKHHENMDGSGYPNGLKGDEIPQIARLIRVVETYVSMSSRRSYRDAMDKETAIAKLREQPEFYDPEVVNALDAIV